MQEFLETISGQARHYFHPDPTKNAGVLSNFDQEVYYPSSKPSKPHDTVAYTSSLAALQFFKHLRDVVIPVFSPQWIGKIRKTPVTSLTLMSRATVEFFYVVHNDARGMQKGIHVRETNRGIA